LRRQAPPSSARWQTSLERSACHGHHARDGSQQKLRKFSFEMREALREQERREAPARLKAQGEAKLTIAFWRLGR
jgi:hypothetical protein